MIAETTIGVYPILKLVYPILKFILYLLAIFGAFYFINTVAHLLSSKHTVDKFLDKYPNVSELFINKTAKEQNIENNQEIHELNRKIDTLQDIVDDLKEQPDNE